MMLSMTDYDFCMRAVSDPRATEEEREFLAYAASLAIANEPVTRSEYLRVQVLTGGAISPTVTPIFDRPFPNES